VTSVRLRDFRLEDYERVLELWEEAGLPFRPLGRDAKEKVAREIERDAAVFVVAEAEGRLVGVVFGTHDGRKGWINRLAVAPAFQRGGVAAMLVAEVEARLSDMGIDVFGALVEGENTRSMRFFEGLGYFSHDEVRYFHKTKSLDS
jgi:N-acetylglutamate synthase